MRKASVLVLAVALFVAAPAAAAATDWTQFRSDVGQSGANAAETTLTPATVGRLQMAWKRSVGEQILDAAPLVVGDKTIISSWPSTVAAFSAWTGQRLWTFDAPSGEMGGPLAAGGGTVYAGGAAGLYALDATSGAMVWHRALRGGDGGATVVGGVVYVPSGYRLLALDAATGATLWSTFVSGQGLISTPSVSSDLVLVGTLAGVRALDRATGEVVWSYKFAGGGSGLGASLTGSAAFAAAGRAWVKLDLATGAVIWKKRLATGNSASSVLAIGEGLTVLHVDRTSDTRQEVVTARSTRTGEVVWSVAYPESTDLGIFSSPAIAGGVVYVGFSDQRVRAFEATTGTQLWQAHLDATLPEAYVYSSPSVANGQLEIGTAAGTLYAFRLP